MLSSRKLWILLSITALCATVLFVAGFGYAIRAALDPTSVGANLQEVGQKEPPEPTDKTGYTIVTLGDSLTRGLGDESGKGYTGLVKDTLTEERDGPVYMIPFAVNGYRSDQLLDDLSSKRGMIAAIEQADLILLSVGANDFIQLGEEINPDTVRHLMPAVLDNIEQIYDRLIELNEHAQIIYVGLYHPFAALDPVGEGALLIQQFNQEVFRLTIQKPQVTVVPTFDLFYRMSDEFLSADLFHPSQAGYERIAERVLQVIAPENDDKSA